MKEEEYIIYILQHSSDFLRKMMLFKSIEFLSYSSLPSLQTSCASKQKLHLTRPRDQVTSNTDIKHKPSLSSAEILPTFFGVSHPETLQHPSTLCSQGAKVIKGVLLCCNSVQLELLKCSYCFS